MTFHLIINLALLGFRGEESQPEIMIGQGVDIRAELVTCHPRLALSFDGSSVFVASNQDSKIHEYNTSTKKLTRRIETPLKDVRCLSVSLDGTMLAAGGDGLMVYDLIRENTLFNHKDSGRVNAVAFSSNNKAVAFGNVNKKVKVLSLPDGKEWRSFEGFRGPVMCVSFSPNDNQVAAGGIDQTVRIWDLKKGEEKQKIVNFVSIASALAYSEDGNYLAFSGIQPIGPVLDPLKPGGLHEIKVWNLKRNKADSSITNKMTQINALFLAKDAKYVVAGSDNGLAFLWQRDQEKAEYSTIWKKEECRALAVSRSFQKMATANKDGSLTIWELRLPK